MTISGDGFKRGKVFLDQTDGAGGGNATVQDDGTFTSGEVAAGNWRAFQEAVPTRTAWAARLHRTPSTSV
ncbi:hypothetical protein [Streptomyces sp. NPDC057686]|uniref:hypothetical protein n=1 Tax=Streptomyces sp. NPDC057686 TaxID=3346212 RepID=UPI0036ACE236